MTYLLYDFTAHQQSSVKVIFSEVCIYLSTKGGGIPSDHNPWCSGPHFTVKPLDPGSAPPPDIWFPSHHPCRHRALGTPQLATSGGYHWRPVQTCSFGLTVQIPHMVLTSGGHQSMYGWQVGGMHPTGRLSCVTYFCCHVWKITHHATHFWQHKKSISLSPSAKRPEGPKTISSRKLYTSQMQIWWFLMCMIF